MNSSVSSIAEVLPQHTNTCYVCCGSSNSICAVKYVASTPNNAADAEAAKVHRIRVIRRCNETTNCYQTPTFINCPRTLHMKLCRWSVLSLPHTAWPSWTSRSTVIKRNRVVLCYTDMMSDITFCLGDNSKLAYKAIGLGLGLLNRRRCTSLPIVILYPISEPALSVRRSFGRIVLLL